MQRQDFHRLENDRDEVQSITSTDHGQHLGRRSLLHRSRDFKEDVMNYIKQLEVDKAELTDAIITRAERIQEFREHLLSPKFAPVQSDGSRGDWIAVADVFRWLQYIEDTGQPLVY
jgi:hypothetical protein